MTTFRILLLSAVLLFAVSMESPAAGKRPKDRSLSCGVNAAAGKRAATQTTQIRKKGKRVTAKPAKKASPQKQKASRGNNDRVKPARQDNQRQSAPRQQKTTKGRAYGGGLGKRPTSAGGNFQYQQRNSPPVKH